MVPEVGVRFPVVCQQVIHIVQHQQHAERLDAGQEPLFLGIHHLLLSIGLV